MFAMALALSAGGVPVGIVCAHLDADFASELHRARVAALAGIDLWDLPFTDVDIETTGAVAGRDGITEIALVAVNSGKITRRWSTFINPAQPIPQFITHLT